jgi:UDP-glucose 4-epimerase
MFLPQSGRKPVRAVVLGGSGFLGQRLCRRLVEAEFFVHSVSRSGQPQAEPEPWWSEMEWTAATLGTELCSSILKGADLVFHLASTTVPSTANNDIATDLESNVLATVRTLEALRSMQIRRLIFLSSGGTVYGVAEQLPIPETHATEPICAYGIHKLTIEKYLQLYRQAGLGSIVLRVANMYGESQDCARPIGAIAHFANRAVNGGTIEVWGDGTTVRDYIHVDDVVAALLKAAHYEGRECVFNIGTGRGVSINELIEMLRKGSAEQVAVRYTEGRGYDVPTNVLDIERARRELSWSPEISLEDGLYKVMRAAQLRVSARVVAP